MNSCCGDERRTGRPRNPDADEAILSAVYEEIAECGFSNFRVESVATRAGVGKATIYRRWPTREELIVAAAQRVMAGSELPDTGSLRDDLVAWYWHRYELKGSLGSGRLIGQVIVESSVNPELQALFTTFLADRRNDLLTMFERARSRGENVAIDSDVLFDLVSGALMHQSLFRDEKVQRSDIERYVDAVLRP